uniref:Not3 domain-containing protein n=1 Tax=Steinernema glaseri TaxID=37863 RepID=A0A1I8AGK6_9BILA
EYIQRKRNEFLTDIGAIDDRLQELSDNIEALNDKYAELDYDEIKKEEADVTHYRVEVEKAVDHLKTLLKRYEVRLEEMKHQEEQPAYQAKLQSQALATTTPSSRPQQGPPPAPVRATTTQGSPTTTTVTPASIQPPPTPVRSPQGNTTTSQAGTLTNTTTTTTTASPASTQGPPPATHSGILGHQKTTRSEGIAKSRNKEHISEADLRIPLHNDTKITNNLLEVVRQEKKQLQGTINLLLEFLEDTLAHSRQ